MKIIGWLLTVLLVAAMCAGCAGEGRIVGNLTPQTIDGSKPAPQATDERDVKEPMPHVPDEKPSISTDNNEMQFVFTIEGRTIGFDFDMQMDDAQSVLEQAGFEYEITDDTSTIRSWAGWRLRMHGLSLVFDADKRLHEIVMSQAYETSIPIKIGGLVSDMMSVYGEAESFDCPEYPQGAVAVLSCEYEMDGYYIRPVFAGERIPSEEYTVWEIFVSKYSRQEYEDTLNSAKMTMSNSDGERAPLFIGMTRQDAIDTLKRLGIDYHESKDGTIMGDVLLGEGPTFDNDAFAGYSYSLYFDWNDRVCTVDAMGSGVWTSAGLSAMDGHNGDGDDKQTMLSLYGKDYYERPMGYENDHIYRYRDGGQYVYICTYNFGESEIVTGFYISRYTGVRPFQ